jgi:hypothetical protein
MLTRSASHAERLVAAVDSHGEPLRASLDPHVALVLTDAVTCRPLSGARQLTNVLHHRIADGTTLDPIGDTYTDWLPQVDDPQWRTYLTELADTADQRRRELGEQLADAPEQWAVEAFGAPPADRDQLKGWVKQAGAVAAHHKLTGHDDPTSALGPAPKAGQVEAYASWRSAWRALGRPESGRDELEMSDGQLLVRVRAHEREVAWGPKYVADELAGTRQAVATRRQEATMRRAGAAAAPDAAERDRLTREAAEADALADVLDERVQQLADADEARALWFALTAETRAAVDRSRAELSARRCADQHDEPTVTAEEWLAAHAEDVQVEDQQPGRHRRGRARRRRRAARHRRRRAPARAARGRRRDRRHRHPRCGRG